MIGLYLKIERRRVLIVGARVDPYPDALRADVNCIVISAMITFGQYWRSVTVRLKNNKMKSPSMLWSGSKNTPYNPHSYAVSYVVKLL